MSQKSHKQFDEVMKEGLSYRNEENSGFKSAFLYKPISQSTDHHDQDFLEGFENANQNSDSFMSEKKKSSNSKLCEQNFKNCLSTDLLQRLEENSPIKSNRTFKSDRLEMNYMTNYTERNQDDCEDQEESPANIKYLNKGSHSLFYGRCDLENEMGKLCFFQQEGQEDQEDQEDQNECQMNLLPESLYHMMDSEKQESSGEQAPENSDLSSFLFSKNRPKLNNENRFNKPVQNFKHECFNDNFDSEKKENFAINKDNYSYNSFELRNFYGKIHGHPFMDEEQSEIYFKSPNYKRLNHLDEDIAFYPKNYNRDGFNTKPTSNELRHRESDDVNQINKNPFNDSYFNNSVNNLFKNKINVLDDNYSEEPKFNSLIFSEKQRNNTHNTNSNLIREDVTHSSKVATVNDNHKSKSLLFNANHSEKNGYIQKQNIFKPNQFKNQNSINSKTITSNSSNNDNDLNKSLHSHQIHNSKSYIQGKSGWVCINCKNFNYESKFCYFNNLLFYLARIKCNRCERPQIKNQVMEKETNQKIVINSNTISTNTTNTSLLDKKNLSTHFSATNKSSSNNNICNSHDSSNQIIYNKNPNYLNINNKQSCQLKKDSNIKKSLNAVPDLVSHEPTSEKNISSKDFKDVKDSPSPDISTKANSIDSKKKKKPFVERVGDWVCIQCKNLNFSFRVVCNRCQLTKEESENLFDQYMKNLMNYVKLNEILQNQIFNNSNFNNFLQFNGLNNQLFSNLNKNIENKKTQIPFDPVLLNYLKIKCFNSNGFSQKTNFSSERSNSNVGINENYYKDSLGDKLGNKSKLSDCDVK
jgi:hypothetical protein